MAYGNSKSNNSSRTSSKLQSPSNNNKGTGKGTGKGIKLDKFTLFPESPDPSSPQATSPVIPPFPEGTETINLTRETFNRKEFNATVNTNFTQLGVSVIPDLSFFDPSLATVEDFFTIYQSLFYQIPKEGEVNSHVFLIKSSLAYTQYITRQEEIEALQSEIAQLQTQNLTLVGDIQNLTEGFSETIASLESTNNQ